LSDPVLHVEDLSISFPGRQVLDRISLDVHSGELLSIVGPSGCGKSTLLNAFSGLLGSAAAVRGTIRLAPGARLGYMFQRDALLPWFSALRNVAIGAELRGLPKAERNEAARRLLRLVGLEGFESYYPAQLSGGMRQRVSLARVLAYDADVILLDEPFVALDAFTRLHLQDQLLTTWRETGKTMVIVTHDPDEALALGTRVLVLDRNPGRIYEEFELDWPADRSVEELRKSEDFALQSRKLWASLLAVGASASARDELEPELEAETR
jgi:NitT/TauT family transport system ATP-binding protein